MQIDNNLALSNDNGGKYIKTISRSNLTIERPQLMKGQRALDFGAGFYLTSSQEQAAKWSRTVTRRNGKGRPIVSIFELDLNTIVGLRVLKFDTADGNWLDYVVKNRRGESTVDDYDVVIGPVANDNTLPVIDDYMAGVYTKEEAVKRLLPQNLTDQYAFKSIKAITLLNFKEAIV